MSDGGTDQLRARLRLSEARRQWGIAGVSAALVLGFLGVAETLMVQASARRLAVLHDNLDRIDGFADELWARQERAVSEVTAVTGPIDLVDHELEKWAAAKTVDDRLTSTQQIVRGLNSAIDALPRTSDADIVEYLRLRGESDALWNMWRWYSSNRSEVSRDWNRALEHHTASLVLTTGVVATPEPGWLEGG